MHYFFLLLLLSMVVFFLLSLTPDGLTLSAGGFGRHITEEVIILPFCVIDAIISFIYFPGTSKQKVCLPSRGVFLLLARWGAFATHFLFVCICKKRKEEILHVCDPPPPLPSSMTHKLQLFFLS